MADFDLVGKLALKLQEGELAKLSSKMDRAFGKMSARAFTNAVDKGLEKAINSAQRQAERFVNKIERDMERVARSANKSLTKAFDDAGKKASRSLRDAILAREKQSKTDKKLLDNIIGGSDRGAEREFKKRISIEKKELSDRKKVAREAAALDEREVLDSQAAFRKREAITRQEVAARVAARNKLAQEDEAEVKASQRNFQVRERLAKAAVTARVREDAAELKAGQKAFERREKFARESVKSRLAAGGGGPPKPPGPKVNPLDDDPAFNFGRQSALAFKRFAAFSLAAGSLYLVADAFRDAIREAVDFESQLVQLAQVSNSSVAALKATRDEVDNLATSLGVSSSSLIESAVTIRQAGFSLEDTNAALETLALTTLSPSFNDLKNTTEGLIALRSQFGTAANDFKRQFGEINAVSKAFAVESEDIVTAIRKSGGAFKVAGGNVTELISLFTAVRSTTRESADTIATGFRTIFARLQRPAVIDELKAFNIELRDVEGNFVGPLKAVEEINKGLGAIGNSGDLQFARIAEQIGGIRQISKVIPLIQQFTVAQRAANIARLGATSLEEDAAIAQTSLANRLTKTKERFLEFARELTINEQFKDLTNSILSMADAFTSLGSAIAPILPSIALAFGISNLGAAGRFAQGFSSKIGGKTNLISQRGFAQSSAGALPFLSRRQRLVLGSNLPLAGAALGVGIAAGGAALGNTDPLRNRRQFLTGRTLERAGGGITGGALAGAALGSVIPGVGTLVGGSIGALLAGAQQGLTGFNEALQEAQDALEDSEFRPTFDKLSETISLVNAGRINPTGQRGNLVSGFAALNARGLSATGVERDQLRGDVRQTVETLLQFNDVILASSKTMEEFNNAGGAEAIQFIAENSILSATELKRQAQASIDSRSKEEQVSRRLIAAQEKLVNQANLINSFGAAIADATAQANNMAQQFQFAANNAFGNTVGVSFRGAPGLQDIFSRPGQVSNLGLLRGASNQVGGFLGPQFAGLGNQAVGTAGILKQLPGIISEFALKRPSGAVSDSIDTFVEERLTEIARKTPGGSVSLQPIIDSITSAITSEISAQGKGQSEAIQKILDAPAQFIDTIVSNSGFEQIFTLFNDAAAKFTDRFNVYASQFADITTRELSTRESLNNALSKFFDRSIEVARVRSPKDFPIGALRARRTALQQGILGPNANQEAINNPAGIRTLIRNNQSSILEKEAALQRSSEVGETKLLIEQIIRLQGETQALSSAFELAVDRSDEIAAKFAEIDKIQLGRDQLRQGFDRFVFGNNQERRDLNRAAAATQLVAVDPSKFFDTTIITEDLRQAIFDLAQSFSNRRTPGFFGVNANGQGRTGDEFLDNLRNFAGRQFGAPPEILNDLREGPNAAQEKLLEQIQKLAEDELKDRQELIKDERNNIDILIKGIDTSLDDFVKELRANLIEQQTIAAKNRLDSTLAQEAALKKQIDQFKTITDLGGSGNNLSNQTVLGISRELAKVDNLNKIINAFDIRQPTNFSLNLRRGGDGSGRIRPTDADRIGTAGLRDVLGTLGIQNTTPFIDRFRDEIAKARDESEFGRDNISGARLGDVFDTIIKDAVATAKEQNDLRRDNAGQQRDALNAQERVFLENIGQLDPAALAKLTATINELGAIKLDDLTKNFNELSLETKNLTGVLNQLNKQLQGNNPKSTNPVTPSGATGLRGSGLPSFQFDKAAALKRVQEEQKKLSSEAANIFQANKKSIFSIPEFQKARSLATDSFAQDSPGFAFESLGEISSVNGLNNAQKLIQEAKNIRRNAESSTGLTSATQLQTNVSAAIDAMRPNTITSRTDALSGLTKLTSQELNNLSNQLNALKPQFEQLEKLDKRRDELEKTRDDINKLNVDQINSLQGILNGITQNVAGFVNNAAQITKSFDNFPRNIEMQGTHTVNVNINGAQALASMQPAMEAFVQSEIQKAINKFTADTLPGALSYS